MLGKLIGRAGLVGTVGLLVLAGSFDFASAQEVTKRVTITECVQEAMNIHPSVKQAKQAVEASEASLKSVRGSFGPSLTVEGNVIRWDEEQKMSFGGGGGADLSLLPPPQTVYEQLLAGMLSGFSGGTIIQEQVTWQVSATLMQPITPLWTVYKAYQLGKLGINVAQVKEEEARIAAALNVVDAYYAHLQARAMLEVIQASIKRVQAALEKVEKLKEAQLVGKGDVLKVKVALASALQGEVQAKNAVELTRAVLAAHVGWSMDVYLEPADISKVLPSRPSATMRGAMETAIEKRPELAQLRLSLQQVGLAEEIVWAEYIPTVVALGTYTHAEGSPMRKEDSYFIGLNLSWKVFEWGKTWYKIDESRAQARQLQSAMEMAANYISLEVKRAWLDFSSAFENLKATEVRIEQAEENFRIQSKLYEEQYKTSTDLLEAEADLTEATAQRALAFYKVWQARAAMGKAMGDEVETWLPASDGSER